MYIQTFFLYGEAIVALCMLLLIFIFAYMYFRVNRGLSSLQKEFTQYKDQTEKQASEALLRAKEKAQQIINDTELFTDDIKKSLYQALQKSINDGSSTYKAMLSEVENKTAGELMELNKTLKTQATTEMVNITKTVDSETKKLTEELNTSIEKTKKDYQDQLLKEQTKAINDLKVKVISLLPEVLNQTVSTSLSEEDQEKLVIQAIDKIKSQHGF